MDPYISSTLLNTLKEVQSALAILFRLIRLRLQVEPSALPLGSRLLLFPLLDLYDLNANIPSSIFLKVESMLSPVIALVSSKKQPSSLASRFPSAVVTT